MIAAAKTECSKINNGSTRTCFSLPQLLLGHQFHEAYVITDFNAFEQHHIEFTPKSFLKEKLIGRDAKIEYGLIMC